MTIARNTVQAATRSYDLVIVGGGIYGVAAAFEAARRGLAPVLLERGDFGQETSWNSLRIVHGGLRYLQTFDLARYFESVRERSWFLRHFPEEVAPQAFAMPLYDRGSRRRSLFRAATFVSEILSAGKNRGLDPRQRLPPGRVLGRRETLERFPYVDPEGLRGAGVWHDAVMTRSQRVVMELLHWSCSLGATALNYCEVTGLELSGGQVRGVTAHDRVAGTAVSFAAPVIMNCAGPWSRAFAAAHDRDLPQLFRRSLAFNVLLDRKSTSETAVALTSRSAPGSTLLLVPLGHATLAGTFHAKIDPRAARDGVPESLILELLDRLNQAAPGLALRRDEVLRVHWGELPAAEEGSDRLAGRPCIINHSRHGGPSGLYSLSGVKFTTARRVAEEAVAKAFPGHRPVPSRTDRPDPTPIPSAESFACLLTEDAGQAAALVGRVAREEAVIEPDDLLLRRTDWGMHPRRHGEIRTAVTEWLRQRDTAGGVPRRNG